MLRNFSKEKMMRSVGSTVILLCSLVLLTAACGRGSGQQAATENGPTTRTAEPPKTASPIPEAGEPLPPGKYVTTKFKPALSFRIVDGGWANLGPEQPDYFFFGYGPPESPLLLGFGAPGRVYDPERLPKQVAVPEPKDWVAWYRSHPYLKTEEPTSVSVGGVSGVQFETEVSSVPRDYPEDCPAPCIPVWRMGAADFDWIMTLGDKEQITIVDTGGETVIIDALAPEDRSEKLLPKAQKVLDTVEWEGA
jgi:hypothetical protein